MNAGLAKLVLGLMSAGWIATVAAAEEPWPTRQLQIIVPLPAGSAADTVARLVGGKLSERLHQNVLVINRDGASGTIGTQQVAKAEPDGYTLGLATSTTLVTAPILDRRIPYDGERDFAPVAMIGYSPYVLVTNSGVPAKTVTEFIALAKAKPATLTYSSVGEASLARLAAELLAHMSGVSLVQVPYKSSTQAVVDLLGGRIDSQFGILSTTHQYIKEGKLNALGVTTLKRVPDFPDMPTLGEMGLPGYEATLWLGLVAPSKTPPSVATRLNAEINAILAEPSVHTALAAQAIVDDPQSRQDYGDKIKSDLAKWRDLAIAAGLTSR